MATGGGVKGKTVYHSINGEMGGGLFADDHVWCCRCFRVTVSMVAAVRVAGIAK